MADFFNINYAFLLKSIQNNDDKLQMNFALTTVNLFTNIVVFDYYFEYTLSINFG